MRKFILFILAALIMLLIGIGISYFVTYYNVKTFEGLILDKTGDYKFENELITSYKDYQAILEKYNGMGKLTREDFVDKDYLVDFVPYVKDMIINDIQIEMMDETITIVYSIDKDVSKSKKVLVNFIPLEKGKITDFSEVIQEFK